MTKTGGYKFYNKVAKKFGGYITKSKHTAEYQTDDPEKVFKNLLIKYSGKDKVALDLGCADGRFTINVAPNFKNIVAIDLSEGMLQAARDLQKKKWVKNVSFEKIDAHHTPYRDHTFDIIYSRRGPSPLLEIKRLLKTAGYYLEIGIGEKDCQGVKELFGRGQDYGKWTESTLQKNKESLEKLGFKLIIGKDYYYAEYYPDYENLDLFLQGVPIFTDFDSKKDKPLLRQYVKNHQTPKGISLPRHRIVIAAQKTKL